MSEDDSLLVQIQGIEQSTSLSGFRRSRVRKCLTLGEKLEIIEAYKNGDRCAKIARDRGINESSIRTILKRKTEYEELSLLASTAMSRTIIKRRSSLMCKMERLLMIWIDDCNRKGVPVSQINIQNKAVQFYHKLKADEDEDNVGSNDKSLNNNELAGFSASRGWFYRFKKRSNIQSVKINSDTNSSTNSEQDTIVTFVIGKNSSDLFTRPIPNRTQSKNPSTANRKDRLPTSPISLVKENKSAKPTNHSHQPPNDIDMDKVHIKSETNTETDVNYDSLVEIDERHSNNVTTKSDKNDKPSEGSLHSNCTDEKPRNGRNNDVDDDDEDNTKTEYTRPNCEVVLTEKKRFTLNELESIIRKVDELCEQILGTDPNPDRSNRTRQSLQHSIRPYKEMYARKKEKKLIQIALNKYFSNTTESL